MKILPTTLLVVSFLLTPELFAQSDQQLSSYLRRNPDADTNGDGKPTRKRLGRIAKMIPAEETTYSPDPVSRASIFLWRKCR